MTICDQLQVTELRAVSGSLPDLSGIRPHPEPRKMMFRNIERHSPALLNGNVNNASKRIATVFARLAMSGWVSRKFLR
jgi:hypothetical protein